MTILKFDDVSKVFYSKTQQTTAVSHLSFEVNEGEFVAIIGPSGCGKTTILSLVCKLIEPTGGKITYGANDSNADCTKVNETENEENSRKSESNEASKKGIKLPSFLSKPKHNKNSERASGNAVGYMLQRDQLFEWRTIEKNIVLGLEIQNKMTKENIEYASELLKKYGLWEFRKHYPQELSGGMRQRVALIRTLATNPGLLLLDEPFSALDFQTRLEVCDDVYSIIKKENKTALLVTHDISEAISLADKIIVLTKRPATLLTIHDTNMSDIDTPLKRRQSPTFSTQFEQLHKYLHGEAYEKQ